MTTLLKLTLVAVIVFLALGTKTSVMPNDVHVTMGPASVNAQLGFQGYTSDPNCAAYCTQFPAICQYNQNAQYYCNAGTYNTPQCQQQCVTNPALCGYNNTQCAQNPSICTPQYC